MGMPAAMGNVPRVLRGEMAARPAVDPDTMRRAFANNRVAIPVDGAPSRGPDDAPITLVIFSDFQCPFCGRVLPTLERVEREFVGQVRFVFRHNPLPFHRDAMPAAQVAVSVQNALGDDAFWRLHDVFFANQRALDTENLIRFATQVGMSATRVRAELTQSAYQATVAADQALAAQVQARGTPNFFINGRQLTGAQPFERFAEVIRSELAMITQLEQSGFDRSDTYAAVLEFGTDPDAVQAVARRRPPRARTPRRPNLPPNTIYHVPVGNSPFLGRRNALVTMVVFTDLECPFCGRLEPTIATLRQRYGRELRVVFKHNPLPFHRKAPFAHRVALEVLRIRGREQFFEFVREVFANRQQYMGSDSEQQLRALATRLGARNLPQLDRHQPTIEADQAVARQLRATGTPTMFINGRMLRGAQPENNIAALIDEEMSRARSLLTERRVTRRNIYERAIRDGVRDANTPVPTPTP